MLRSIVNQSSYMTDNTIKETPNTTHKYRAIRNGKNKTTDVLRGANRYGVLDEESTKTRYKISDLIM